MRYQKPESQVLAPLSADSSKIAVSERRRTKKMYKSDEQQAALEAVHQVLRGDIRAYAVIFAQCDEPGRSYVRDRYYCFGLDFENEVMSRAHARTNRRLAHYRPDMASFLTWFMWSVRAAVKQVIYEWYGEEFLQYEDGDLGPYEPSVAGPEAAHDLHERSRLLRRELKGLPEEERLCIVHHDLAGRTFVETARRMKVSVGRVRWKRDAGLRQLRMRARRLRLRPTEVDTTPVPVFHEWDRTEPDDYAAPTTARLPHAPDTLVGAAAKTEKEDDLE